MRQRAKLGIVAAALLVLLVGCGSSSEEPTEPQDTSEAPHQSTSSVPSTTGSDEPPGEENTTTEPLDDAAKAEVASAVEAYLAALNEAYRTGDTTEVNSLIDDRCGLCVDTAAYIDDVYGQGGRIDTCEAAPPHDVVVSDLYILDDGVVQVRQVQYSAKIVVTECVTYDASGNEVSRDPDGTEPVQFLLNQEGDRWIIRDWELQ